VGTAQRSDIFHVEILQQILVDDRFDRAGRGSRAPWRGPAVNQDVQAAQLLRRLGDHAVHLLLAVDIGCEGNAMRRFVSAASSRAVASRSPLFQATIATSLVIFWAKTRMGWRETSVDEHRGKPGYRKVYRQYP
jgi:hypothetical protein